jgi:hypothetical protein
MAEGVLKEAKRFCKRRLMAYGRREGPELSAGLEGKCQQEPQGKGSRQVHAATHCCHKEVSMLGEELSCSKSLLRLQRRIRLAGQAGVVVDNCLSVR